MVLEVGRRQNKKEIEDNSKAGRQAGFKFWESEHDDIVEQLIKYYQGERRYTGGRRSSTMLLNDKGQKNRMAN